MGPPNPPVTRDGFMEQNLEELDTILLVDDEESVRQTVEEWLRSANLGCRIQVAGDAESALKCANEHIVDLAVLDWNLGGEYDGLRLLEDLTEFNPDIVAILITGYAHKATPLQAMRMGVRDYLDKNQDFNRTSFLEAVRKQLNHLRPLKRQKRLQAQLEALRSVLEKVLPLVQTTAALTDSVTLPSGLTHLFRFLQRMTGSTDGALVIHRFDPVGQKESSTRIYNQAGELIDAPPIPFSHTLAASVLSQQDVCAMNSAEESAGGGVIELYPFEKGRTSLLAVPFEAGPCVRGVLEVFDKQPRESGFTQQDRQLAAFAAEFASELLRLAASDRLHQRKLLDAVEATLRASESFSQTLHGMGGTSSPETPPPREILEELSRGWEAVSENEIPAPEAVALAESIRVLHLRHGTPALRHCRQLVENLQTLLDEIVGM